MKVLMLNGSPHTKGATYTALSRIAAILAAQGIESEIFQLGSQPVRDCLGCGQCQGTGCVFPDERLSEFLAKAKEADGFVFGSPVYFSHPSGQLLSFLDRAFYSTNQGFVFEPFTGKPGAAVVVARRGGCSSALDVINKYFTIASMPVVSSTYWNMVYGNSAEEVTMDEEGLQTMRNLGRNMARLLQQTHGCAAPDLETRHTTNFIR